MGPPYAALNPALALNHLLNRNPDLNLNLLDVLGGGNAARRGGEVDAEAVGVVGTLV
jgi:hypothetical protein